MTRGKAGAGEPARAREQGRPAERTRERVRSTIGLVGGYWRPLAATARLLEELGELGELDPSDSRCASELADLWIISTALADQFLGAVAEPGAHAPRRSPSPDLLSALVAAAGRIARIVNYYDGPKTPRSFDGWISLSDAVAEFHCSLADVAHAYGVDLAKAVHAKLDAIPAVDSGRFREGVHDPSTARSVERFRALPFAGVEPDEAQAGRDSPPDLDIPRARLWGSPDWSSDDPASNVRAIVTDLTSFAKAAPWEGLEGYVIYGLVPPSKTLLDDWLARLLEEIGAPDLAGAHLVLPAGTPGDPPRQLSLNGLPLPVSVRHRSHDLGHPVGEVFLLLVFQR